MIVFHNESFAERSIHYPTYQYHRNGLNRNHQRSETYKKRQKTDFKENPMMAAEQCRIK